MIRRVKMKWVPYCSRPSIKKIRKKEVYFVIRKKEVYFVEFMNFSEDGYQYPSWWGSAEEKFTARIKFRTRTRTPFFGWDCDRHRTWMGRTCRKFNPPGYYEWPWNRNKI